MAVEVLDGVVNGDDMGVAAAVDRVHHTGQSGGLAPPGGTRDQDHAPAQAGDFHNLLGDVHILPVGDAEADHPDHGGHGAPLAVGVHPEAGQIDDGHGEIVVPGVQVAVYGPVRQLIELPDHGLRLLRHHPALPDGDDGPLLLHGDLFARYQEQVRRLFLHGPL